jgi:hypothetical protein
MNSEVLKSRLDATNYGKNSLQTFVFTRVSDFFVRFCSSEYMHFPVGSLHVRGSLFLFRSLTCPPRRLLFKDNNSERANEWTNQ